MIILLSKLISMNYIPSWNCIAYFCLPRNCLPRVQSIIIKEIGAAIPGWNNYIEINLLNDDAASNSTDTTSSVRDERSTTDAGGLAHQTSSTKSNTNNSSVNQCRMIETKLSKSDDSIDSGLNTTLNNTLTWDDLFNSISKWKPLGYGLCGVVRLAFIKVSSITTLIMIMTQISSLKSLLYIYFKGAKVCRKNLQLGEVFKSSVRRARQRE